MAFSLSHFHAVVHNYASALAYFENCTPWRGESDGERPLIHNRARHMGVRVDHHGDVVFRLYGTDVVTYTSQNILKLQTYRSQSTDAFANSLTPSWLMCCFNSGYICYGSIWSGDGKLYPISHYMEIDLDSREIISGKVDWTRERINVKRANVAYKKYGIPEFRQFLDAYIALAHTQDLIFNYSGYKHGQDLLDMLADRSRWADLVKTTPPANLLDRLCAAVRRVEGCYDPESREYLTKYTQVRNWL